MREAVAGFLIGVVAVQAIAGSPAEAVMVAWGDAQKLAPDYAAHAGYLSLYDLPPAERPQMIQLVRYALNSVSTEPDFIQPVLVGTDLLRIDRRDPGPAFEVAWEATADVDPMFHLLVQEEAYEEVPRETKLAGGILWAANDAKSDWVRAETVSKTIKTKKLGTKGGRKSVLATRQIEGCPTCQGWLPTKETLALAELCHTRSPMLSAQWFWARASRQLSLSNREDGTGYYDWLGVKKRDDFFKVLRFREEDSVALGKIIRAAVDAQDSGVAQNGRQVQRLQGPAGAVWLTLDVDHPDGDQNPTHQLKRGELVHQAEEYYAALPNGLPGLLLSQANGTLQPSAPDFIGSDGNPGYGGRDFRIHVQLSCIDCHSKTVLRPVDDWVRKTFVGNVKLQSPDYQVEKDFQRQFFSNLERQRAKDALEFTAAMEEASGLKIDALVTAIDARWKAYANTPLTADAYGQMLGYDGKTLVAAMRAYNAATGGIDPAFAPLIADKPGGISRQNAEEFYPNAQAILWGYKP
jgi:hypothetical protein